MGRLATILCLSQAVSIVVGWSYHSHHNNHASWGGVCDTGGLQSPVNIVPTVWQNLSTWSFNNYNTFNTFNITNNGHTAKVYLTTGKPLSISGADLPGKFIFAQGHFHWGNRSNVGSEHLIGGRAFPLELHLVHYNSKYLTLQEALKHKDGLAVVAVLYELSSENNGALSAVIDMAHLVRNPDTTVRGQKKLSLKSLLPSNLSSFYRYSGSLTTPTCDEVVTWSVLHTTGTVSEDQLHQIRNILDSDGYTMGNNFRSSQALNNRAIVASGVLPSPARSEPYLDRVEEMAAIENVLRGKTMMRNETMVLVTLAMIVLFTQCGFVFLEAGAVGSASTVDILSRNWLAASCGALVYWALGFGLTWGEGDHPFSGASYLLGIGVHKYLLSKLFFEFTFSLTASTLVSGALSERFSFRAFIVYTVLFVGFIFPIFAHWAWHSSGWLSQKGFYDFAGSGVVHLSGAACALAGCLITGPRDNRFTFKKAATTQADSLSALGSFILIFGYIAQNAGKLSDETNLVQVVVNTAMATCVAALSTQIFNSVFLKDKVRAVSWMNGALTGAVSVAAGCDVYSTWAAMLIGLLAGPAYSGASRLMVRFKIDDPVDAISVNGAGGIIGCLCVPLLREDGLGLFYTWSLRSAHLFLWNILGMFTAVIWSGGTFSIIFYLLKKSKIFRLEPSGKHKTTDLGKPGEEVPLTGK